MRTWERLCKRALDITVSGSGLLALAPGLLCIAAAIKLDSPGPALFRQKRLGYRGQVFEILKFRTMLDGASVIIGDDHTVVNPTGDSRLTRMGGLLRHISLDELPQLINVFIGDMSIVGPRPDLPEALGIYTDEERIKLEVKPGITGLSQVSGRNLLSAHDKWSRDAQYVKEVGILRDLTILVKTIIKVAKREGIYKESIH